MHIGTFLMNARLVHGWVTFAVGRLNAVQKNAIEWHLVLDTAVEQIDLFIYLLFNEVRNWCIHSSVGHCCGDQDIQDVVPQLSSVIVFAI